MNFKTGSLLTISMLAAATVLTTVSCKKSNSGSSSAAMSATVGSTGWNASQTVGLYVSAEGQFSLGGAVIANGDTTAISVFIAPPITLGLAVNSDTSLADVEYVDYKTGYLYDGQQGSGHSIVTVTSWDTTNLKIGGTFSGVLYNIANASDSTVVTSGKFSMSYTKQ